MSISLCGSTSIGPDMVHYAFLKHMDETQRHEILKLFTFLWEKQCYPVEWTKSHVIPILKPGKPAYEAKSYRPIQLTSCLCKVMERILARRLSWYVEKAGL